MEIFNIAIQKEVQIWIISKKNYAATVLGCPRSNFGTLSRWWHKSKQCVTAKCFRTSQNLLFKPNTTDYYWKVSTCCIIIPIHTCESLCQLNYKVVLIWLLMTVTCLVHSEMLWEATISPGTKKWKKQGMHCLSLNQKQFFSQGTERLQDDRTKCVEKQGDYIEKLILLYILIVYVLFNKKINCRYLFLVTGVTFNLLNRVLFLL
jgi:hypothetical protein